MDIKLDAKIAEILSEIKEIKETLQVLKRACIVLLINPDIPWYGPAPYIPFCDLGSAETKVNTKEPKQ